MLHIIYLLGITRDTDKLWSKKFLVLNVKFKALQKKFQHPFKQPGVRIIITSLCLDLD